MKKISYTSLERVQERFRAKAKGNHGRSHIDEVQFCQGYAEPGYTDPESGWIAFGNWNTITKWNPETQKSEVVDTSPKDFGEVLEKMGVELEWSDEWDTCCDCYKAVRTSPDSYGWMRSYAIIDDCECVCHECIKKDPSGYIDELVGEEAKAMTIDIDLSEHGFVQLESGFENGFHSGQDADPKVIAKSLRKLGIDRFIFVLDDVGQFDISFSLWVDKDELAGLDMAAWDSADKDGPSVSQGLEAALRCASSLLSSGNGIQIINCDVSTGTAEARTVTPQEFIDGIKD